MTTIGELIAEDRQKRGFSLEDAAVFLQQNRPESVAPKRGKTVRALAVWLSRLEKSSDTVDPTESQRQWLSLLSKDVAGRSRYLDAPFERSSPTDTQAQDVLLNFVTHMPNGTQLKILHFSVPFASTDAHALALLHLLILAKNIQIQYFLPKSMKSGRSPLSAGQFLVDIISKLTLLSCEHFNQLAYGESGEPSLAAYTELYAELIDDDIGVQVTSDGQQAGNALSPVVQMADNIISCNLRKQFDHHRFSEFFSLINGRLSVFSLTDSSPIAFNPFGWCLVDAKSTSSHFPEVVAITRANHGHEFSQYAGELRSFFAGLTSSGFASLEKTSLEDSMLLARQWGVTFPEQSE